jgi:hypothetical protein
METTNEQYDFEVCKIGRGASNKRFRQETVCILEEKYKHRTNVYTDGSKKEERVGYSVIWNHQKFKKRVRPQNTIFSAAQSAKQTAIHSTINEPGRKLIETDFLSTLVAASGKKDEKKQKTRTIRKLLRQKGDKTRGERNTH